MATLAAGLVIILPDQRALVVPEHPYILANLPAAPVITWGGGRHHVLLHDEPTTLFLRRMGLRPKAPILRYYDWRGDAPFEAQKVTAAEACINVRLFILNDIGTGKTRSVLFALDWLRRQGRVRKALVIAPLSILETVWWMEATTRFGFKVGVLHGAADRRRKILAQDLDLYVVNYDGLPVLEDDLLRRRDLDLLVVDELALLRNDTTRPWKIAQKLVATARYVWGLTGNPTPNSPLDAYGQLKLIQPTALPGRGRFKDFRDLVAVRFGLFKWLPRPGSAKIVARMFQPATRFLRSECIDLPPTMTITHKVALSPVQAKIYKALIKHMGVVINQTPVTAANAGVLLGKLVQVGSGVIYDKQGLPIVIGAPERENLLREILTSFSHTKALVFVPFRALAEHLAGLFPAAGLIHGGVSAKDRAGIFSRFQNSAEYPWIFAQPRCMAHGLTLTAASVVVWYAPVAGAETYEQANGRVTRPGQTSKTYIAHIEASFADRQIFRANSLRTDWSDVLLDVVKRGA